MNPNNLLNFILVKKNWRSTLSFCSLNKVIKNNFSFFFKLYPVKILMFYKHLDLRISFLNVFLITRISRYSKLIFRVLIQIIVVEYSEKIIFFEEILLVQSLTLAQSLLIFIYIVFYLAVIIFFKTNQCNVESACMLSSVFTVNIYIFWIDCQNQRKFFVSRRICKEIFILFFTKNNSNFICNRSGSN